MAKYKLSSHVAFSHKHLLVFVALFAIIGGAIIYNTLADNPNLPGDINNDNIVDITDLSILLSNYGTTNTVADLNKDGIVNITDLSIILSNYGKTYTPTAVPSNAFLGTYYDNSDFTNQKLTRTDNAIDFNWISGSPDPTIGVDTFSVKWEGNFNFETSDYIFTATVDDGVRIYVDNTLIMQQWFRQNPTTYTVTKTMTAGVHNIKVEFYEEVGGAQIKVNWAKQTTTPPPTNSFKVGLSMPTVPYYYYDTNTIGSEFDKLKQTFGPNIWLRIDFALSVLESPSIGYIRADKIMAEANSRGLKVLPVFSYAPSKWNGGYGNDKVPPIAANYDAYASRIADAVKRYNFSRIETWNEPWLSSGDINSGAFWLPKSDPAAFNALNTKITNAVWAVAPTTSILIQSDHFMQGGNNPGGATFFPAMWAATNNAYLRDSRIVYSVHTYCEGTSPTETRAYGWGCDRWKVARDIAKQNGVSNPRLSVTEFGWRTPTGETNPRVVSDSLGAQYTNQILAMMKADGVEDAYYFEWAQMTESWTYNLQRADGSVKPAALEIKKFADGLL